MADIVEKLVRIADGCKRKDGSDIPLGSDCRAGAAEIRGLRAEITRLRAASEWRDISTAPRDGTIVDLWSGVRLPDCRWESSSYAYDIPWGWGNSSRGRILNATHWMPLPAPPQRNEVTKPNLEEPRG